MSKNVLDTFLNHGVDLRNFVISLEGEADDNEVDYHMAIQATKQLMYLDNIGDKDIKIMVNSPGGWVSQGMAIYDTINQCRKSVTGLVTGEAYSMASIILQACDERIMLPNSTMMIHNGNTEIGGKTDDVINTVEFEKHLNKVCEDIYLARIKEAHPRFTRKKLQELLRTDTWLTSTKAVELGLADFVLYPKG